jgi:predicted flap endonuclease-1-like 5' DNA nuclease
MKEQQMADLVLGPSGGSGGYEFQGYAIPAGATLREIRINAGLYVDGLQLVYSEPDGALVEMAHLGGRGGLHHTLTLDADEYLTSISGRCGRYIDSIRLQTNKRTTDRYGGSGGEDEYHFEAAAGREIAGFIGRGDWFIDQLGVIVRDRAASSEVLSAAPAVAAATPAPKAAKPRAASQRGKKAAPETELVAMPDAAPVTPPAPDLIAIPDSTLATPPAPTLIGIPDSAPVDATAPELVGMPDSPAIAVDSASMTAGERTATVDLGVKAAADDLTKIEGIGPKVEQVLADAGVTTYAQLAATPAAQLREILNAAGSRYRITDPTTWPDQAALAAAGDWAAFNELVRQLKAERRT